MNALTTTQLAPVLSLAQLSPVRRNLASASFGSLAILAATTWDRDVLTAVFASSVAVAAVGVQSANLAAQVAVAAVGWSAILSLGLYNVCVGFHDHAALLSLFLSVLALVATGGTTLFGRPAEAQFAPLAARRSFVASAILAMIASGVMLAIFAIALPARTSILLAGLPLSALTLLGVFGLLRMRAWGFLAVATAGGTSVLLALTLQIRALHGYLGVPYGDCDVFSVLLGIAGMGALSVIFALIVARLAHTRRTLREGSREGSGIAALR